jgi:hypothetical protein
VEKDVWLRQNKTCGTSILFWKNIFGSVIEKPYYGIAAIMELPIGKSYTLHMAGACIAWMQFLAYAAGGSQETGKCYSWETNIVQEPAKVWFQRVPFL